MTTFHHQLHTHTFRCNHAKGDVEDYVAVAKAGGCMILGFSEHTCHPKDCSGLGRLQLAELPHYRIAIETARLKNPDMRILYGMECEWRPEWRQFYLDLGCQYLIGSVHTDPNQDSVFTYSAKVVATIRAGIFEFVGHPDQFFFEQRQWNAEVESCAHAITDAAAAKLPLEINGNRALAICVSSPGTVPPFWEMAGKKGCTVVINSDAHFPEHTLRHWDLMNGMRERIGLVEASFPFLTP